MTARLILATILSSVLVTGGCNGAVWGNLAVLALSVAIFFSTLSLGRQSQASERRDSASPGAGD